MKADQHKRACLRCGKSFSVKADWQEYCTAGCNRRAKAEAAYGESLSAFPSAGCGNHDHMMRVANLGVLAGLDDSQIKADILKHANRKPTPDENAATVENARANAGSKSESHPGMTPEQRHELKKRRVKEREIQEVRGKQMAVDAVKKLSGPPITLDDLRLMSHPITPHPELAGHEEQRQHAALMLSALFGPSELVYTGEVKGTGRECLKPSEELINAFLEGAEIPPFFIVNPFTGESGLRKNKSGRSFRADDCISSPRYALYECDIEELTLEMQAAFIASRIKAGWPIVSVVYSGGKSLHALIRVDCRDAEQWQSEVKEKLFPILSGFGADDSCKNKSRLSRLPGHRRDNGNMQSLIYLNLEHGETETTDSKQEKS